MQFSRAVRAKRAFLAVALATLMAACGGGGGDGDGGAGPSVQGPTTFGGVSVSLSSAPPVQATLFEGTSMQSVSLEVGASGDIDSLNGKTIFVIVEDPASLFEGLPFVSLREAPPGAFLRLGGRKLDVPGHFQGDLKIHACLDAGCSSELAGSPMAVPFDVTVLPGLTLDRQAISVTVPFGQIPPVQTVSAGLPSSLISWGARDTSPFEPRLPGASMRVSNGDDGGSVGTVSLELGLARPGTYALSALVFTNATAANGIPLHFEKTVTVTYTVTPDPTLDFAFAPVAGNITRVQGDRLAGFSFRQMVTNEGVTDTGLPEVEYLSHPPAADGHPQVERWWSELGLATFTCFNTINSSNCLPAGTYTARVRFTLRKNGIEQDVFWPITLQIVPG